MSIVDEPVTRPSAPITAHRTGPQAPALIAKLSQYIDIPPDERAALLQLLPANVHTLAPRSALVEQGGRCGEVHVVLDGWACRYATLPDRKRQIVAFYLPGDVCEFNVFLSQASDQTIAALTPLRVSGLGREAMNHLSKACPHLTHGMWWESAVASAIQRRWTINVAQRSARRRLAHLLCELSARLAAIGQGKENGAVIPVRQSDLSNACALTVEHTNRTIQDMRSEGLLGLTGGAIELLDVEQLRQLSDFDASYLQLRETRQPFDTALTTSSFRQF